MSAAKSPLQSVKERFGDKAGLLKAVIGLMGSEMTVDRLSSDKGLDSVSNKKLLHLHDVLDQVKKDFGSRSKLINAIVSDVKRTKDADYIKGLERFPTPRLFELYRASKKRTAAPKSAAPKSAAAK